MLHHSSSNTDTSTHAAVDIDVALSGTARHSTAQHSTAQHSTGVKGLSDMRTLNSIDRIESVCRYCSKS
jgi:hypothetical protein